MNKPLVITIGERKIVLSDALDIISTIFVVISCYVQWGVIQINDQITTIFFISKISRIRGATTTALNIPNIENGTNMILLNILLGLAVITGILLTGLNKKTGDSKLMMRLRDITNVLAGASVLTVFLAFTQLSGNIAKTLFPEATSIAIEYSFGVFFSLLAGALFLTSVFLRNIDWKRRISIKVEESD